MGLYTHSVANIAEPVDALCNCLTVGFPLTSIRIIHIVYLSIRTNLTVDTNPYTKAPSSMGQILVELFKYQQIDLAALTIYIS